MIDPLATALAIIRNDPAIAEPTFDLLLWAAEHCPELKEADEWDDLMEMLYVKLQHCRDAREAYMRSRTVNVPDQVSQSTS